MASNSIKEKKKPAAKLDQIIIPDKERKPSIKPDTLLPVTQQVDTTTPTPTPTPISVNPDSTTDTSNIPVIKQLKKRGRKRKIPIDPKYTNAEYIVMWPEICMAQKVLVDRYDNVYTYDLDSPTWIGVKTVYGKIDNITHKAPLTKYYFQ